ncbi:hypothetical protein BCR33DRAFT_741504 [Rhizoclosmatium globosum]|uniref:Sfi1 spindle body domain-containing protein n=1 Tax=Rhizoclosmatium globosum TaxID=329046 RepID=A0A1Y2BVK1_9FUNG|nr:hypothetical protein BCR33DRAFT_741504 [Rhizoclosmatium globosum]|eukprot:ORY38657.1 hypothetical protein BCR33DRAFT_741504 [Rhizoclosmatium globosum]
MLCNLGLNKTKKADRFRATQVTQVHWTRWRNNVIENSEQVLSALLYQKWITILSFHRWVVVFQKRINASVFTTGEVELAPADPYSLRRVPYDKYPSYYVSTTFLWCFEVNSLKVPHSANQSEPKSLIKLLLSVRVSGWAGATATDYPKSAQAALELNRSTPPNIRLSFGTLFERKRQDQAMRQSFKSWKQHTENVARNERLADEFRDEMLQNTCFRQWRKQWKHRATLAQLELEFVNRRVIKTVGLLLRKWWYKWMALNMQDRIVSENFRVNLVKAVFGDWLYLHKLNQAALQVSEINNFVYVTELFLFWKRRAVESRRDRILKMKAVDMSEIRTTRSVFLHWRNKATNYRLERLLTLRAVEYWKAKTCRAVIHGIRSCILTRQTEVTLAAILFLRLRRGIYFQKWRECLSLKRRCDQMATLSNAFRTLILERKAMNTWRAATLRNFKFAVINLKLAQKERRQLQAMCILKWRHRADQSIKASKMIKTRELQLRDAMFLNWKNKTGLRRQSGIFFREHQKNPLLLRFFKTWKERTRRVLMQRIAVESYEFNRLQMFVMMWKQKLKQRRKTISVQQAFTKLEEFCSINLLRVAFQAFKDNRKRSLALEEVYSSSLRLKLARSIGVPRTSRSSVPQIQSLLLEKVYFTTWLERYLSQTLADQLRKTQLLTKHLRKWRAALIPINEQRVTSDQFNSNRIKTRVWETWTDRLGAVQILRERSQMKRQILMRWYHWARTERSIREFVLKHKFTHWRKVLKKKGN